MDATSAAAAEINYQSGRYHDALLVFERQPAPKSFTKSTAPHLEKITSYCEQDEWITAEDPPAKADELKLRLELESLPVSARLADIAMCRFQSALHSYKLSGERGDQNKDGVSSRKLENESTTLLQIWKEAIRVNTKYQQSLIGAASSLIQTCFIEMEFCHQIKQLSVEIKSTNSDRERRREEQASIQNAMKNTAVSMLMSSVAFAHLHLYGFDDEADDKSWTILVESAMVAADLICVQRNLTHCITGNKTNVDRSKRALEQCLEVLNETMVDERSSVALHSFRTALKVAALASGKLVLPDVELQLKESSDEPVKKKPKTQEIPKQLTLNRESNAWNATYAHSNLALHARERLVDAISFHSALTHCVSHVEEPRANTGSRTSNTINDLYMKREACFKQALEWESKMKTLVSCETSPTFIDDASGYVWKTYTCIRALDMSNQYLGLLSPNKSTDDRAKILSALEILASSSTSKFACDMLGCINAQNGDYLHAIEMFQLSLERGHKAGEDAIISDIHIDTESCHESVDYRAASNMAMCFVAQGGGETALELLLEVWAALNDSNEEKDTKPQPTALWFGTCDKYIENACTCIGNTVTTVLMKILWLIFHVSSLVGDLNTSLGTTELMNKYFIDQGILPYVRINIANAFSFLQCRRDKDGQEVAHNVIDKLDSISQCTMKTIISILGELYIADGALTSESIDYDYPIQCTNRAMVLLNSCTSELNTAEYGSLHQLRVLVLNNCGIGCLTGDDSAGALCHFRKAAELAESTQCGSNGHQFWLLVPIHFNLALLLLRDGRVDESAKAWLSIRGHFNTYELAKRSDSNALSRLRDAHLMAMNKHGMILAKRNIPDKATVSLSGIKTSEWVAPIAREEKWQEESTYINGVDAAYVCTLDFILLKHALSVAEKRCGSLQRNKTLPFSR